MIEQIMAGLIMVASAILVTYVAVKTDRWFQKSLLFMAAILLFSFGIPGAVTFVEIVIFNKGW